MFFFIVENDYNRHKSEGSEFFFSCSNCSCACSCASEITLKCFDSLVNKMLIIKHTCVPLAVESVDRICDHSFEGQNDNVSLMYFFVMLSIVLYEVVLTINSMHEILCLLPFYNAI